MFSWDKVPGNDSAKLQKFLKEDLNIEWVENAEIHKSDDGKAISISKDEKSVEIMIDTEEEKATLKFLNGRIHDLKVKKENGKLNISETSKKQRRFLYGSIFYYTGYWSILLGLIYLTSPIQLQTLNYPFFIPFAFLLYTFIINLKESVWEIRKRNKLNGIILLVLLILFIIISVFTIPIKPFLALLRLLN